MSRWGFFDTQDVLLPKTKAHFVSRAICCCCFGLFAPYNSGFCGKKNCYIRNIEAQHSIVLIFNVCS